MNTEEIMRILKVIKDQRNRLRDPDLSPEERVVLMDWIQELEEKINEYK